jgi:putative ABC transport system ATP-binding protein
MITEMTLFQDFNLKVDKGEFVSIVGSNGSGKTSMLNIICGSIPVESGDILVDGTRINHLTEYKRYRTMGRIFQNPAVSTCPDLTLLENMALADNKGKIFGLQIGVSRKRVEYYRSQLAELHLGLEDKLDVRMGAFSGGQRQAVALIMATMSPLSFLILDEHTAALDPSTADRIMELTDKVVREKKLTALMVTHNLRHAVTYGDRLLMMHPGGVVVDKSGEEKQATRVEDLLDIFNEISVECGN